MENLNLQHKDNISKFLHRDLTFLINSYVNFYANSCAWAIFKCGTHGFNLINPSDMIMG